MFQLFFEGGWLGMSLLTVELICLLFAAWKAPAWVREIGLLALVTGVVYTLLGFSQAMGVVREAGDIAPSLLAGGLRVACIPIIYGLLVYALSLVVEAAYLRRQRSRGGSDPVSSSLIRRAWATTSGGYPYSSRMWRALCPAGTPGCSR